MIYISSCDIITINARTSRQHWLGKALLRFWPALTPQFSSESGHNDGGILLQKPPYPFVGSKTKTWAKLAQCSFLSLTFLMLSLLWQRETFFSFQKSKTFNSFNKQLYAWASTHCWANREKKKTKAAMKQSRCSLLPCFFISNSGTCIRKSADTRNLRSHHTTSFLYS